MKKLYILLVVLLSSIYYSISSQRTILYSQDFEHLSSGYISSTNSTDSVYKYEWASHSSCTSSDIWRINSSGGYGTNASITGSYASIDYGSQSCVQDISFSTLEFTPSKDLINISFDWAFQDYTGSSLIIRLYDENGSVTYTLVNATSTSSGNYNAQVAVTPGVDYSLDFRYIATWDYGAKIDNILVTELASGYEEIIVGTGTSESALVPAYGYYDYSWSGMIYLQSEIDKSGTIKYISWYVDNSSPSSFTMNNQKIYLGNTNDNSFDDNPNESITSDLTVTDYTLVYDGSITWQHGWNTITLSQDWEYLNTNNILVKIENRDGSYTTPYPSFDYTTSTDRGAYDYADDNYPTVDGTRTNIRPNIMFTIQTSGAALPIDLISFNGEPIDNHVRLNWVVASQINNDYYTIEKSIDNYNWVEIAIVNGDGNSNQETHYSIYDEKPNIGNNYYRLKQTDYDGLFKIFQPIVVFIEENKYIIKTININGQQVDFKNKGLFIDLWNNGEATKYINK